VLGDPLRRPWPLALLLIVVFLASAGLTVWWATSGSDGPAPAPAGYMLPADACAVLDRDAVQRTFGHRRVHESLPRRCTLAESASDPNQFMLGLTVDGPDKAREEYERTTRGMGAGPSVRVPTTLAVGEASECGIQPGNTRSSVLFHSYDRNAGVSLSVQYAKREGDDGSAACEQLADLATKVYTTLPRG
jgi:hypothetical protein